MRFCPFAHRVHLLLSAKKVPYHVVYINLSKKPEWYGQLNPNGKVPALHLQNEPGKPFLVESLVICEYLDEKYPEPAIYPRDPLVKAQAKLTIERLTAFAGPFYRLVYEPKLQEIDQTLEVFHRELDSCESELKSRNTLFFGGNKPNIIDYAIWPWFERFTVLKSLYAEKFKLNEQNYPSLVSFSGIFF